MKYQLLISTKDVNTHPMNLSAKNIDEARKQAWEIINNGFHIKNIIYPFHMINLVEIIEEKPE